MNEAKHTPGPWRYHLGRGANPRLHIQMEGGYQIASTTELSRLRKEAESQHANARLIAAAPELLEALQEMLALTINWTTTAEPDHLEHLSEYRAVIKQARAAIAKAEGRQ